MFGFAIIGLDGKTGGVLLAEQIILFLQQIPDHIIVPARRKAAESQFILLGLDRIQVQRSVGQCTGLRLLGRRCAGIGTPAAEQLTLRRRTESLIVGSIKMGLFAQLISCPQFRTQPGKVDAGIRWRVVLATGCRDKTRGHLVFHVVQRVVVAQSHRHPQLFGG